MRIISQDRTTDIPYESFVILKSQGHLCEQPVYSIRAYPIGSEDFYWELGKYSTKEEADYIMKDILYKYNCGVRFYEMPQNGEKIKVLKGLE